jgi:hypothetical protein
MNQIINKIRELNKLQHDAKLLQNLISEFNLSDNQITKLEVGCRVECEYSNGSKVEGRIWRIKNDGTVAVNRDGYKAEMLFSIDKVKNLSVGTIGIAEKELWLKKERIRKLRFEIESSNYENIEFGIKIYDESTKVAISVHNLIKLDDVDAWIISYNISSENKLRKVVSSNRLISNLTPGKYILNFSYGALIEVEKL